MLRPTLLLAIAATGASIPAQSITFLPRVDFGMAQENAQQTVCADFDHDGHLDLATSLEGYNQGKVEILFGDGQSDFGTSTAVTSYVAWGMGLGDWNGDGFADLAASSHGWSQHGVRIWSNDGQRGLVTTGAVSTLAVSPSGVVAGDLDGDGVLDLAAISESGGYAVDWFHGNGDGTFGTFHVVPNTYNLTGRRIYAGDLDGDPHLDLLAIHQTGAMVLRNDSTGAGNFSAASGIPSNEAMSSGAIGDLDADGTAEIVTAGSNLRIWRRTGPGSFVLLAVYPLSTGALETLLGDLDGDGVLDLVSIGIGGVQIFVGTGLGTFAAPLPLATGVYPKSGAIGDWNGDGWNDLAITCQNYAGQDSYLAVHEQLPPAVMASATTYGAGCGSPPLALAPDASGRPRLGQSGAATIPLAPSTLVAMNLGWSDQWAGSVPLPAPLGGLGMPGCELLHSTEILGLWTTPIAGAAHRFTMAIPTANQLLGSHAYLQAFAFAPGANALQLQVSNGIAWTIGNQ